MSKKRKRLSKSDRQRIIQSLVQEKSVAQEVETKAIQNSEISNEITDREEVSFDKDIYKELKKISLICLLIIIIFVVVVYIDNKTDYLDKMAKFIVEKLKI